jgi:hypothetical protein
MYKAVFLILFIFSYCLPVSAQSKSTNSSKKEILKPPQYPGGEGSWRKFQERFFSDSILSTLSPGSYKIDVIVDIDTVGHLNNIKMVNQQGPAMARAIKLLFKRSPRWIPASKGGRNISVKQKVTITLNLCPTQE